MNNLRKIGDISQEDAMKAFQILAECKDKLTHLISEVPEPNKQLLTAQARAGNF